MRGEPSKCADIFKSMQKQHEMEDRGQVVEATIVPNSTGGGFSRPQAPVNPPKINMSGVSDFNAGAYQTLMRKRTPVQEAPAPTYEGNVSVGRKKIDAVINEDILVDWVQSAPKNDSINLIRPLFHLYTEGILDNYEISGLNKSDILNILEDFKAVINRVVM